MALNLKTKQYNVFSSFPIYFPFYLNSLPYLQNDRDRGSTDPNGLKGHIKKSLVNIELNPSSIFPNKSSVIIYLYFTNKDK